MGDLREARFPAADYEFVMMLGSGFSGEVHLFWHKESHTLHAVKFAKITPDSVADMDRFRNEITTYASFRHPAAVRLLDYGVPPMQRDPQLHDQPFLVLEFLPGGPLSHYIQSRTHRDDDLHWRPALFILYGVAKALQQLHSLNIVHRDVKPANVLLDARLRPFLADFGFARSPTATRSLSACGTLDYIAPEMLCDLPRTDKVDVWSFGCLVYAVATGHSPFHAIQAPAPPERGRQVKAAILAHRLPVITDPHLSVFQPLYAACVSKLPEDRPTMAECAERVLEIARAKLRETQFEALMEYKAQLEAGAWPAHGTIAEVEEAKIRLPLAQAVYGVMVSKGIGFGPANPPVGKAWIEKALNNKVINLRALFEGLAAWPAPEPQGEHWSSLSVRTPS